MPKWVRASIAIGSLAIYVITAYATPDLGPVLGALLILLNVAVGASAVAARRLDRRSSGADDPATLNLNR